MKANLDQERLLADYLEKGASVDWEALREAVKGPDGEALREALWRLRQLRGEKLGVNEEKVWQAVKRTMRWRGWRRRMAWAAAMAGVVLAGGLTWWGVMETKQEKVVMAEQKIQPGESKAMLVLDNGNMIDLTNENRGELLVTKEVLVENDGKGVNYLVNKENVEENAAVRYNELVVPKGCEYSLKLADGTNVWLNAESRLKYPVVFKEAKREVYLEGEAYFEVVQNYEQPFVVRTRRGAQVKVLGTSFNVRDYADEDKIEAVLEEGKIALHKGGADVVLEPGFKAVCGQGDSIRVEKVNTELYTSWRKGQYVFVNERVENILTQLSRWYNMEVFYRDEKAKAVVFSGDVRKYNDISVLLEAMEIAGDVRFEVNGRVLIVDYQE